MKSLIRKVVFGMLYLTIGYALAMEAAYLIGYIVGVINC